MPESWEEKLDAHMKRLEARIEEIGQKVETKGEEFSKKAHSKAKDIQHEIEARSGKHSLFWGIVLILVGLIWLGSHLGWIHYNIPWVPVAMIVAGIYLILRHRRSDKADAR